MPVVRLLQRCECRFTSFVCKDRFVEGMNLVNLEWVAVPLDVDHFAVMKQSTEGMAEAIYFGELPPSKSSCLGRVILFLIQI